MITDTVKILSGDWRVSRDIPANFWHRGQVDVVKVHTNVHILFLFATKSEINVKH